jgi:antitoxin HicB
MARSTSIIASARGFKCVCFQHPAEVDFKYGICKTETLVRLQLEPLEEGGYVATSPDVPGLVVMGDTLGEIADIARGSIQVIIDSCIERNEPLPPALAIAHVGSTPLEFSIPVSLR